MFTNWKISTAFLLASVFLFRILFVNIGIISTLNTQRNKGTITTYFSSTLKKRRQIENVNSTTNSPYAGVEICEEDTSETNTTKSTSFFLLQVLYSFFTNKIGDSLKRSAVFSAFQLYSSSPRYLTLQVIRI